MHVSWYLRRLCRMGPSEVAGRALTATRVHRWRREFGRPVPPLPERELRFTATLPAHAVEAVPPLARQRLFATADEIMDGQREYFGMVRSDLVAPDWSFDPKTGRRAPDDAYAFDVRYRDENTVGDIKQLWEPSRHQHLTQLAAAFALTGDDRYAHRVADHLKSWWAAHPPMHGVHWISGIELGIRLVSWVWVRRLLDGWSGVAELFEHNAVAVHQIRTHQRWLADFPSRGSSANNHVIAELAGQLAAACAFDWFPESPVWRDRALATLDEQLQRNTFASGLNREQATEYHGLVMELGLAAAAEATAAGLTVPESTWRVLLRMTDALAAIVDARLRPPRQGDGDDGFGLVLDGASTDRWAALLTTGGALFGRLDWWPATPAADVRSPLLGALVGAHPMPESRPAERPGHFADAGMTILRAGGRADGTDELWCRCDGGPHGFLAIAAHAHADALSVEVRVDGVDVLADPGCYCYHGEPQWRDYFRSTRGHNTLELDDADQSRSGGPFMWTRHAASRVLVAHIPDEASDSTSAGAVARWLGEHDGYGRRGRPVVHRRTVELHTGQRTLQITDSVTGSGVHPALLSFHLGPTVDVELTGARALLRWPASSGDGTRTAELSLPADLDWTVHRGRTDAPLGWYSPGFGSRVPTASVVGRGTVGADTPSLVTTLSCGS
jgi:hypothetical protein